MAQDRAQHAEISHQGPQDQHGDDPDRRHDILQDDSPRTPTETRAYSSLEEMRDGTSLRVWHITYGVEFGWTLRRLGDSSNLHTIFTNFRLRSL